MSRAIRESIAKIFIVEATAGALSRAEETKKWHPSLLWLEQAASDAVVAFANLTDKPAKTIDKVAAVIERVKALKDDLTLSPDQTEPEPHSDVYLASAITMLLDDLVSTIRDKNKLAIIEPLHECAVNVESELDRDLQLFDVRKEADMFVEAINYRIAESL